MAYAKDDSSSYRISALVQKVPRTAKSLNEETDRLNKAVLSVAEALKPLNLGITSWLQVSLHEAGPFWETEEIGYAKVKGKWGIALRKAAGDQSVDEVVDETIWFFEEGPRDLRIRAASLLPALIEKLHDEAEAAVASVAQSTLQISGLAAALSVHADKSKAGK